MSECKYKLPIAIDLGATNMRIFLIDTKNKTRSSVIENNFGLRETPCCVYFSPEGDVVVGKIAKTHQLISPERTVSEVKRIIGKSFNDPSVAAFIRDFSNEIVNSAGVPKIRIKDAQNEEKYVDYSPEEITAFILTEAKEMTRKKYGEYPDVCIITVPVYFTEQQRRATEDAANIAGLNCARVISDPIAACLTYLKKEKFYKGNILVYDFGGITLDTAILEVRNKKLNVRASAGTTELGGSYINSLIFNEIKKRFIEKTGEDPSLSPKSVALLMSECEEAKIELSSNVREKIIIPFFYKTFDLEESLTRAEIMNLCGESVIGKLIEPIEEALNISKLEKKDINQIVLVGGSSSIPFVRDEIEMFFEDESDTQIPIVNLKEPICVGAAEFLYDIMTEEEDDDSESYGVSIVNTQPISIGLKSNHNKFIKFIKKGEPLPQKACYSFSPNNSQSKYVILEIYQGEENIITKSTHVKIGRYKIENLPGDGSVIDVEMNVDENGVFTIKAKTKTGTALNVSSSK